MLSSFSRFFLPFSASAVGEVPRHTGIKLIDTVLYKIGAGQAWHETSILVFYILAVAFLTWILIYLTVWLEKNFDKDQEREGGSP